MGEINQSLFSAPATPQMKVMSFLLAGFVLLLFGKLMRESRDVALWPWLIDQWGYLFVWAVIFLIIFLLLISRSNHPSA